MHDGQGLSLAEELVIQPLEDSPLPLSELRWANEQSGEALAEVLAPGLISLVCRGLVEVRRFDSWPTRWEHGVPLTEDELVRECQHAEAWSGTSADGTLAVHITRAGIRSGLL